MMKKTAESFSDIYISAYECWQMYKVMREYRDKIRDNSGIWRRFGTILQHYWVLQIAKIHDHKKHGKDDNLSLEYFVSRVDKDSYTKCSEEFLGDNKEFIGAIKKARNKVVAHPDLKVYLSDDVVGAFSAGQDEKYFNSLHKIISEGYKELGLDFPVGWSSPSSIVDRTRIFMDKISKVFISK